jgi:hypothetical protein
VEEGHQNLIVAINFDHLKTALKLLDNVLHAASLAFHSFENNKR